MFVGPWSFFCVCGSVGVFFFCWLWVLWVCVCVCVFFCVCGSVVVFFFVRAFVGFVFVCICGVCVCGVCVIAAFIQKPQDYFDAAPTFKQSCVIQSGEIFSIFKQIKESFDTNLSDGQKEEMANQKAYEDLKVARSRLDKTK